MEMTYNPKVQALENKVSYGTLGILNTLVIRANDNDNVKKNTFLINGATIVRNCYDKTKTEKQILDQVAYDAEQLRHYFEAYAAGPSVVVFYFHPNIRKAIPEFAKKQLTDVREEIDRITDIVAKSENVRHDQLVKIGQTNQVTYYALVVSNGFAYQYLTKAMSNGLDIRTPKIWLSTHNPIDMLILDDFPTTEIIESHTGKILTKKDLSIKVFKDPTIPFNRTTLKLLGDKEFIKAAIRNKPKAIAALEGINLKTKTEKELMSLAKTKLGIDPNMLTWRM